MKKLKAFLTILIGALIIAGAVANHFWPELSQDLKDRFVTPRIAAPDVDSDSFFYAGAPLATDYPNKLTILKRTGYIVAYDEKRSNPAWVAYKITLDKWDEEHKRPSGFDTDNDTRSRITHKDYTNSGFDRGHMAPNEAISESYGRKAQRETFLMSNVVPQRGDLNQGPWRQLEQDLVDRVLKTKAPIYVITGPYYDDELEMMKNKKVEIPDGFFKVAVQEVNGKLWTMAILMPEDAKRKAKPTSFKVAIDAVEVASGFDLFERLEDEVEIRIEKAQ